MSFRTGVVVVGVVFGVVGCGSPTGTRCVTDADCGSSLRCDDARCVATGAGGGGGAASGGGTGTGGGDGDAGLPVDAGLPADAGAPPDAGLPEDAGALLDAGAPADAGAPDDAGTMPGDAGVDAGAPDAGGVITGLPDGGLCDVTPGDAGTVLVGTVLTPTGPLVNGQVAIDAQGLITCVGASCPLPGAAVVTCPFGVISPGLINTHDHITFSQNGPYTATSERYEHRYDYLRGQRGHTQIPAVGNATASQVSWAELRFVLAGATSTVASGGRPGLLRNLDQLANQQGLGQGAVDFDTFPLADSSGALLQSGTCDYGGGATTAADLATVDAYLPHVAEGIDAEARNEFFCTSSSTFDTTAPGVSNDLMTAKTAVVQGVALRPADYALMAQRGTALVWSPRSNVALYGDTASIPVAVRLGVRVALGTDWLVTGSMNLLRELACADFFNRTAWSGALRDEDLWAMVTRNAAAVTATDDVLGALTVGRVADVTVFDGRARSSYRAVIAAEAADVALVLRGGKPLFGAAHLIEALVPAGGCDALEVCTAPRRVCLQSEIGLTLAQLEAAVGSSIYPPFFCGPPVAEPTCVPQRSAAVNSSSVYAGVSTMADQDGDGLDDAQDNCPTTFNPVRPLDQGVQADADGDLVGDLCDPCPLVANATVCPPP